MFYWRHQQKVESILLAGFAGAFLAFLFFYAIKPIIDPDFWWHLKTGDIMRQNGGLLSSDPFTFSGDGVVSNREAIILKGYWLWEIIASGLYSLFGFNGIFLLNLCTVSALAGVVALELRRQRVGYLLAALLMTLGFSLLGAIYPLERPQVISFLFAAILLALLARVRDGGNLGWPLPLLMMLWANLHGGFVVGDIILVCFGAGAVIEYRQDFPRLRHILLWVAIGVGASLLNPTGALVFSELFNFHNSAILKGVSEYQSTWVKFQQGSRPVVLLWLLIAFYGIGIWRSRSIYWPDLIVALFLAGFSVAYMRNVGFFAVAMLPAIGFYLQRGANRRQWQFPSILSLIPLIFCTIFLLWLSYNFWQGRKGGGPVKAIYPESAIAFLSDSGLQGRMFNSYEYGGYLLWRLAPQIKVFIDGRGVDPKVFADAVKLEAASTKWVDGRREYEALLDSYAIDYIIQPIYDGDGNIQPLMKGLLNNPVWHPIYLDTQVYILARLSPANAEAIDRYRIDKNEFKTRLLLIINFICQSSPHQVGYQVARAGMLTYLAMYDDAKAQIEKIMVIAPNDRSLPALQRELAVLRAQRLR